MFTFTTGRAPRLNAGMQLRRITAVLSVAAAGVLAWAAAGPAASAAVIPVPGAGASARKLVETQAHVPRARPEPQLISSPRQQLGNRNMAGPPIRLTMIALTAAE